VAPGLHASRERVAADLRRQVDEVTRPQAEPDPKLVDWELLRGVPLIGGVIVGEHIPGSDTHLDELVD
jgi:hypothetical protein